jgi:hypothetical protein
MLIHRALSNIVKNEVFGIIVETFNFIDFERFSVHFTPVTHHFDKVALHRLDEVSFHYLLNEIRLVRIVTHLFEQFVDLLNTLIERS